MAKKKGKRPAVKRESAAPKETTAADVKVQILWDTEPTAVHVDSASIALGSSGQFALILCSLSPGLVVRREDGTVEGKARIVCSARMAPQTFVRLTQAMISAWNSFREQVGPQAPRLSVEDQGRGEGDAGRR